MARLQQLNGSTEESQESLEAALKHEYKFTTEEKFKYKASTYGVRGDYASQVKVYDMWIELYPDDIKAHRAMAEILTITGLDYAKALKSMEKIRELDPMDDAILRDLSQLHLLNGEMEKAAHSLEQFIQSNPQSTSALVELADLYERQGMFEKALLSLDKALLLDRGNLNAQLKNIHILIKQFKFSEAEDKVNYLLSENQDPQGRFTILGTKMKMQMARGEIAHAIQTTFEMEKNASHLPPIMVIFQVKFQRALITASIGSFDEAYSQVESLRMLLQRPISDILDVGVLSVAISEKNIEKAEALVLKLQKYFKTYPNPIFESALDSSLGQLAMLKGEHLKAVEYYQKSLKYMSGSVVNMQSSEELLALQAQLAEALRLSGNREEAAKLIDDVLLKFPSLHTALLQHAELRLEDDDFDGAAEDIKKIEKIWENADESLLELEKLRSLKARFDAKRSTSQ